MKSYNKTRSNDPHQGADDSNWFWSNNRGGGGAPLKNHTGEVVSNLRNVLHSNAGGSHENVSYYNDNAKYRDNSSKRSDYRRNDDHDDDNDTRSHRPHRRRDADRSSSPPPPQPRGSNGSDSPRKFMSALQDMNSGMDSNERNARLQKARDYQNALAAQIEEKKRLKENEKRRVDDEKRHELEQYISKEYRGDIPAHVKEKLSPRRQSHDDHRRRQVDHEESLSKHHKQGASSGGGGSQSIYNLMGKGKDSRADQDDDDDDDSYHQVKSKNKTASSRDRKPRRDDHDDEESISSLHRHGQRRDHRHNNDDDTDIVDDSDDDRSYRQAASKSHPKSKSMKKPAADYDELSELCKNLIAQQKQLQDEVRKQANVIEELRSGNKAGPRSAPHRQAVAAVSSQPQSKARSKSTQHARQPPIVAAAAAAMASRQAIVAPKSKQPPPKVAFGGNAQVPKPSTLRQGSNNKQPSTAAMNQKSSMMDKKPSSSSFGRGGQQQPVVKGGPVIVSYDNDDDNSSYASNSKATRGSRIPRAADHSNKHQNSNLKLAGIGRRNDTMVGESMELRGESEYLRIKGNEVDVISGDQLDRLLSQAKSARTGMARR